MDVGNPAPKTYPHPPEGVRTPGTPAPRPGRAEKQSRFGDLLGRPARAPALARGKAPGEHREEVGDAGLVANPDALGRWFRTEIPGETIATAPVRPAVRIAPHHRLLVSSETDGNGLNARARIEISAGKLAGSQIQLVAMGSRIEAQLLTGNQASRQTLTAAMDAVREKLRTRGLLLGGPWAAPDGARTRAPAKSVERELPTRHPLAHRKPSR